MKYTDEQRIEKIVEKTEKLLQYISDNSITEMDILNEETIRWTITTPLYNIGEQAYYLSEEYKEEHAQIPWAKISGLRHRLVHDYEDTNWEIVNNIIFNILPDFLEKVRKL
ncbi:MAG: DUF86 domain-containing protein [Parasporobacterium sp.]|nr:DUF86 domain-containing protein [Parasporobacterium sp.]